MDYKTSAARVAGAAALTAAVVGISACGGTSTAKTPANPTKTTAAATSTTSTTTSTAPSTSGATGVRTVSVKLTEFKIQPSVSTVPAGRVVFDVSNVGKMKHQFTVIRTNKSAATVLSKTKPNDDIPGAKGEISGIMPRHTRKLVIKDLKAGHYALVCALPGHYQAGMYADFTVS